MPKYHYDPEEWAIPKYCHYCGKLFYPEYKEEFCNYICESRNHDYWEDMSFLELENWYKKGEESL